MIPLRYHQMTTVFKIGSPINNCLNTMFYRFANNNRTDIGFVSHADRKIYPGFS